MKLFIYIILFIAPSVIIAQTGNETIEHINQDNKFKINYPKDWILKTDLIPNTLFTLQNDLYANQVLAIHAGPTTGHIDSIYNSTIKLLKLRMPAFQLISSSDTIINSTNCKVFTYKAFMNGINLKLRQFIFVGGGYSYFFIFTSTKTAFDTWIEKYEKVVYSFKQTD